MGAGCACGVHAARMAWTGERAAVRPAPRRTHTGCVHHVPHERWGHAGQIAQNLHACVPSTNLCHCMRPLAARAGPQQQGPQGRRRRGGGRRRHSHGRVMRRAVRVCAPRQAAARAGGQRAPTSEAPSNTRRRQPESPSNTCDGGHTGICHARCAGAGAGARRAGSGAGARAAPPAPAEPPANAPGRTTSFGALHMHWRRGRRRRAAASAAPEGRAAPRRAARRARVWDLYTSKAGGPAPPGAARAPWAAHAQHRPFACIRTRGPAPDARMYL